jgi:hypothetical protein
MRGKIYRWREEDRCGWLRVDGMANDVFVSELDLPGCLQNGDLSARHAPTGKPTRSPHKRIGTLLDFTMYHGPHYAFAKNCFWVLPFEAHPGSLRS